MATRTTKPKGIVVPMDFVKETKSTFVFGTDTEGAAVTTCYVMKAALGEEAPASIVVTVVPA